ncbi:hypothetical protein GUH33_09135 [Xanthomonas citri pv. citri]|nr:hypothetical protein [Xanthomonas citri pv. citri]
MVVGEAVAAMAATPAAIEVNLTIVFVLFVSADICQTGREGIKTYSQKHIVEAALFIPVPPSVITT